MKLLDTNEVCDLLGISRSTLYRWCNMSEDYFIPSDPKAIQRLIVTRQNTLKQLSRLGGRNNDDELITDFPRPFKIGRALKWRDDEIMQWLEGKRI
ncbi:TPA: helix-turn-helix domain-containing protein [Pasteurella multocida]|nr:helix-turn-helix domain-containing protein [Pasteurella multocida]HEA3275832.1 helix-turn-helix domain-containing protein [Pasteurella multocida]